MARIWGPPRPEAVEGSTPSRSAMIRASEGTGRRSREAVLPTNSTHLGDRPTATRAHGGVFAVGQCLERDGT